MINMIETVIERVQGNNYCLVDTGERKFMNKLLTMSKEYPNDVIIQIQDKDHILAHVPFDWFRFVKPPTKRNMTEEQKKAAGERMKNARKYKNNT